LTTTTNDTIARPGRDETAEYYFRYIDLVPEGDIRDILTAQRHDTIALLDSIPESLADHRYAPKKWSVREVLSHINDCERVFTMRAFWFAREMDTPLPSFESDMCVQTARSAEHPWTAHVHEHAAIRASTLALFNNLPAVGWSGRGIASDMPFTVRALAYITAGHLIHHTRVLTEKYL